MPQSDRSPSPASLRREAVNGAQRDDGSQSGYCPPGFLRRSDSLSGFIPPDNAQRDRHPSGSLRRSGTLSRFGGGEPRQRPAGEQRAPPLRGGTLANSPEAAPLNQPAVAVAVARSGSGGSGSSIRSSAGPSVAPSLAAIGAATGAATGAVSVAFMRASLGGVGPISGPINGPFGGSISSPNGPRVALSDASFSLRSPAIVKPALVKKRSSVDALRKVSLARQWKSIHRTRNMKSRSPLPPRQPALLRPVSWSNETRAHPTTVSSRPLPAGPRDAQLRLRV